MGDAARYLDELEAKATAWETRVQIACAQAIVEAINEQTERLMGVPTREALLAPAPRPATPDLGTGAARSAG